jgi:hypothetical protein
MRRFQLLLIAVLAMVSVASAQYRQNSNQDDMGNYLRSGKQLGLPLSSVTSLLDPTRMHMSHSIQMGYYSGGGVSASRGLYMNTMTYDISKPLSVTTHLGIQYQPSGPAEWNPASYGNQFIGGAEINWQPAGNLFLHLGAYRGFVPDYSGFGSYGWGRWSTYPYGTRP